MKSFDQLWSELNDKVSINDPNSASVKLVNQGIHAVGKKVVEEALYECNGNCTCGKKPPVTEAEYQGRNVPLGKPMKGDVKKSKVYVKNEKGNVVKVNFGDKNLSIKKNNPARKRSYCARSSGQGNLTKKTSANYWSRRAWNC